MTRRNTGEQVLGLTVAGPRHGAESCVPIAGFPIPSCSVKGAGAAALLSLSLRCAMFLQRWNNRPTSPRPGPRRQRPRVRRLSLEALEDRTLLTTWFVWQFGGSDQFGNGS